MEQSQIRTYTVICFVVVVVVRFYFNRGIRFSCRVLPWTLSWSVNLNPFLPSLATAVLARWSESAARQVQKTDCLNLVGYKLPCRERNVFKFRKQMKIWVLISVIANFEFVGWIFFNWSCDLIQTPFLEPYGHETLCFEPFSCLYSVYLLKSRH